MQTNEWLLFCWFKQCLFTFGYNCSNLINAWSPAPIAQWLARRTVGRKVWGSNPIRIMGDFSALAGSYPELGLLWAQWEGWNHTAELHPLHGCVFEGVALTTWPTLQVPQFPGLVNTGIIMTVSVVCGPVVCGPGSSDQSPQRQRVHTGGLAKGRSGGQLSGGTLTQSESAT